MIAYFILVHRFPRQFQRLFKAIYNPQNHYLIHVDKKAPLKLYNEVTDFLEDYPNAHILKSQNIVWGGYSMVDVELRAIHELLKVNNNWQHFINLSGQDFPLKTSAQIDTFLNDSTGYSFLKADNQVINRPNTLNRIQNYFTETTTGFSGTPLKRKFLDQVTPYIGGQWKILTRECCRFLDSSPKVNKFKKYYKNTLIPDESFFQTVLMNEGFAKKIINDDKRAIIWIPDLNLSQKQKNYSQRTTQQLVDSGEIKLRPKTYTMKDKKFLLDSSALFARKFDEDIDNSIFSVLEKHLFSDKPASLLKPSNTFLSPVFS